MSTLQADPGGKFASDSHRRILGSLSTPEAGYGWSSEALLARVLTDESLSSHDLASLKEVLGDLEADGVAVQHDGGVWQMTPAGHDLLTSGIANEPAPGSTPTGPAMVLGAATPLAQPEVAEEDQP